MKEPKVKSKELKKELLDLESILFSNINFENYKIEKSTNPDFHWSYIKESEDELGAWIIQKLIITKEDGRKLQGEYVSITSFNRDYEPIKMEVKLRGWITPKFYLTKKEIDSVMERIKYETELKEHDSEKQNTKKIKI